MNYIPLFSEIKQSVQLKAPNATIILFGSYARGDNHSTSDIDLLILLDQEKIGRDDEKRISYPLYDLEFEYGIIINPILKSKKYWENTKTSLPFYENIVREGIVL